MLFYDWPDLAGVAHHGRAAASQANERNYEILVPLSGVFVNPPEKLQLEKVRDIHFVFLSFTVTALATVSTAATMPARVFGFGFFKQSSQM
jgi:hypothetical protein